MKIEVLISELFFLILNEEELHALMIKIKQNNIVDIWESLIIISNDLKAKDFNYLIILDQYQRKVDINNNLNNLLKIENIKIFLLSSVNDDDVKKQFELIILDQTPNIKYIYVIDLLNISSIKSEEKIKKKILDKKSPKINLSDDDYLDNIMKNLENFGLFPKFLMLFLNVYSTIYDLINSEYIKIFKKLVSFYVNNNKYSILKEISIGKPIELLKEEFIQNLTNIPLKYFNANSLAKNQLTFSISYAFPFCLSVYKDYVDYRNAKESFLTSSDGGIKGTYFEKILQIRMRVFGSLKIDGHFEVLELLKMNYENIYNNINSDYFTDKNNILITQKNSNGKLIDFIIFKPKENDMFWIQSKYTINKNNIQHRNNYVKQTKTFIDTFKKKFGIELKIYSFYI